ncbi:MAG: hypothetical protein AAGJ37_11995 [Pseudomonadota bacterium]
MSFFKKKVYGRTVKFWFIVLFILPGIPPLVATVGLVIFSYFPWPISFDVNTPQLRQHQDELILLVHGKDDSPATWSDSFALELQQQVLDHNQQVATVDWQKYSTNIFRCSNNGRRIGRQLGKALAMNKDLKRVHLVGHSAGSFVVYGLCESLRHENPDVLVHTTYLDPLGVYSGMNWHFGTRNFGRCADISDAYIDINDNVPGSNVPVENAHTFDVSALRINDDEYTGSAHMWPIEYYRRAVLSEQLPFWAPSKDVLRRYPPQQHTVVR